MTLDEQIKILESNAEFERKDGDLQGCLNFRQLAKWLREYKKLMTSIDSIKSEIESAKYLNYGQLYGTENYLASGLNKALEIIEKHTGGGDVE